MECGELELGATCTIENQRNIDKERKSSQEGMRARSTRYNLQLHFVCFDDNVIG